MGGSRVPKDSPVIEAGGEIDELSSLVGIARSLPLPDGVDAILQTVQERLLTAGFTIARLNSANARIPRISDEDILELEREIDALQVQTPPLNGFILPGGSAAGAHLHLARAVARRVERRCVALARASCADTAELIRWLNRLSDLLFALARFVNHAHSIGNLRKPPGNAGGSPASS